MFLLQIQQSTYMKLEKIVIDELLRVLIATDSNLSDLDSMLCLRVRG